MTCVGCQLWLSCFFYFECCFSCPGIVVLVTRGMCLSYMLILSGGHLVPKTTCIVLWHNRKLSFLVEKRNVASLTRKFFANLF